MNGKQSKKKNATDGTAAGAPKQASKQASARASKTASNASNASEGAGPMNVDLLQQIVNLMAINDLNTVDVRDGAKRIILKRGAAGAVTIPAAPAAVAHPTPLPGPVAGAASPAPQANPDADLKPIKSPMVGTYYSKPSPDSKPFVTVGSVVNEESDVCIIEAMKTFNNIKAGVRGSIARILVQDGEVVQYDTVLFLVKPS